jgi:purine nucleosidase
MADRIILDTDIGTDVDDCLALAVVLASPELELIGVTCVYGDVDLRSRMVRKLLALRGRTDVPVYAGIAQPLLGKRPIYWPGHEGVGLLEPGEVALAPEPEHAVDYLVRTVRDNPGQIHLVAIGPLTNLALAIRREPRFAQSLAHLTIMGGVGRSADRLELPYVEHNMRCDPEAAQVVFASGAPISLVPLDVTTRVMIRSGDVDRIRSGGTAFHLAVANQLSLYPPFQARGYTHLHDPLAVASVIRPDLLGWQSVHLDLELGGEYSAGATLLRAATERALANVRVALSVDAPGAEDFVVTRLSR